MSLRSPPWCDPEHDCAGRERWPTDASAFGADNLTPPSPADARVTRGDIMDVKTDRLQRWLQTHDGIASVPVAMGFGFTRRDAYRLIADGEFELIMPSVLRSKHWPLTSRQVMAAACQRSELAVICGLTAAPLWSFRGLPEDDGEVHVMVPHGHSVTLPGTVIRRSRLLDPVDVVRRSDGIRLTSPPRTLFDCADKLGVKRSASILEQLINERRVSFVTHALTLARLGSPNRPGTLTMRRVIASRPAWRAALQSELELIVLNEIRRQGLPEPELQYSIQIAPGWRIRFDFAWPARRAGLEVDHPFWHDGTDASWRHKHRDLHAGTLGWLTMRVTDLDVRGGLASSIAAVGSILAQR